MKKTEIISAGMTATPLAPEELKQINGGEDGAVAYFAGYVHALSTAHILTGGLSTIYYLYKKATS